jgi:NodT family efflux transporter outer membrane factor (OMF) lipoprotein
VATGYVTLAALDARLAVTRDTLAARQNAVRIATSRAREGYSPLLEQRQAEAEYQSAAQLIPQLELAIARQEDALSQLVGVVPQQIRRGAFDALGEPPVPAGLPSDLLRRRPDIAQAEYQLAATDALLAAARKRFLPQVRLSATAGAAVSTLLADPIAIWSIGGSVLAPIFEAGRIGAQAESAAAQRDAAAFAYRRTALNAFREVEDNLAAVRRLTEQLAEVRAQRAALADSLRLATNRYRAGYSSFIEQLDAERGLLGAELTLIQVRADEIAARIALYQAMGGGWDVKRYGHPDFTSDASTYRAAHR